MSNSVQKFSTSSLLRPRNPPPSLESPDCWKNKIVWWFEKTWIRMAHVGCVEILKSRTQTRFVSSSAFSLNISPMPALCPIRYKNHTPSPSLEVCILTCKTSLFQKDWICVLDQCLSAHPFLKTPHIDICCVRCEPKKHYYPPSWLCAVCSQNIRASENVEIFVSSF
jgi:hypothetical protein